MLKAKVGALACAVMGMFAALPAVAGDLQQASATVGAIERDMGEARRHAGRFYGEMRQAQMALHWHARMRQQRNAEMANANCARPSSPQHWHHCNRLFLDMREHARATRYFNGMAGAKWANHVAAVNHAQQLAQAGYQWKAHVAQLQGQPIVLAEQD